MRLFDEIFLYLQGKYCTYDLTGLGMKGGRHPKNSNEVLAMHANSHERLEYPRKSPPNSSSSSFVTTSSGYLHPLVSTGNPVLTSGSEAKMVGWTLRWRCWPLETPMEFLREYVQYITNYRYEQKK